MHSVATSAKRIRTKIPVTSISTKEHIQCSNLSVATPNHEAQDTHTRNKRTLTKRQFISLDDLLHVSFNSILKP